LKKSKNRPKNQFAMESDKKHFRLFVNMFSFHQDIPWPDLPFCLFLREAQTMRCLELVKLM